ncbi:MAG: diacylglycerol kinase family lipid kinase [Eubacterium sp.]|nr:diacylglycerol kinase family lipid kinase [Eubacterium sp.]
MKKLLFIINPRAGLKKNPNFIDEAVQVFEEAGYKVGKKFTKKRADATEIARDHGNDVDLIVCMGGDGTLNEVFEGMMEGEVRTPIGYIPAGSTNDFANSLGLETKPEEAAKFIVSHKPRKLDMGEFNGRAFAYTASCGIFTKTSYATSQKLKNKLGHAAYVLSASKEIFHVKKLKMKVELENEVIEGNYIFAAINNATKVGGVMKLDENMVEFNDGLFELMLIEYPKNPVDLAKLVGKVAKQRFTGKITLIQIDQAKITIDSDVDWSLDGEKEKGQSYISFRVIPDAINFIY